MSSEAEAGTCAGFGSQLSNIMYMVEMSSYTSLLKADATLQSEGLLFVITHDYRQNADNITGMIVGNDSCDIHSQS